MPQRRGQAVPGSVRLGCFTAERPGLAPATDNEGGSTRYLREDGVWATPPGGVGGPAWSLHDSWTWSANVPSVAFTGLDGAQQIEVIADAVVCSVSGVPVVQVSTDGGLNWFSVSGNYKAVDSAGAVANTIGASLAGSNSTAARSGSVMIFAPNVTGAARQMLASHASSPLRLFTADNANPINAIRVIPSGGGNFTAGSIIVKVLS